MYTGSCLCDGIHYEISAELGDIQVCHCQQCRKAQGTAFATNIAIPSECFAVTQGQDLLREFESPTRPGKLRVFCSNCGSPIISKLTTETEFVRVRIGTINEPIPSKIQFHAFVGHKANWWEIDNALPHYEGFAPS